jgi:hypothetical protein
MEDRGVKAPAPSRDPIKVVFLGGHGRSGSTILDRLAGQLDGFVSIGELRNLWQRSLLENQLCGCGEPFRDCGFWRQVVERALGDVDADAVREIVAQKAMVDRTHHIPEMLASVRRASYGAALTEYVTRLGRVLAAVRDVSGAKVIVDASKDPSHGFLLSMVPGVELYVVQLVRDSRAVSYSWMRKKVRPEVHWKREYMNTYSPSVSAWHWLLRNLLVHALATHSRGYMLVRYEDFVAEPAATLAAIAALVGRDAGSLRFLAGHTAQVKAGHGIAGNPVRFDSGAVTVAPDVEWRDKLAWPQRCTVTAISAPLLAYYGYFSGAAVSGFASEMGG